MAVNLAVSWSERIFSGSVLKELLLGPARRQDLARRLDPDHVPNPIVSQGWLRHPGRETN